MNEEDEEEEKDDELKLVIFREREREKITGKKVDGGEARWMKKERERERKEGETRLAITLFCPAAQLQH